MTVRKLLIREENGLETRVEYDGMAAALKGAANGVAELGADVKVPVAQLPSAALLALGETSATAYRGDRGKAAYDHSQAAGNPHGTTAAQVGALPVNNPAFTGVLTGGSAALTGEVDAGGKIKSATIAGAGTRPLVALSDGTIDDQDAAAFRDTISVPPVLSFTGSVDAKALNGGKTGLYRLAASTYTNFWTGITAGQPASVLQLESPAGLRTLIAADNKAGGLLIRFRAYDIPGDGWSDWYTLWGSGNLPVGTTGRAVLATTTQAAARATISAAKAPSKADISASTTIGSIDASAIKVTATDVILTLSGGTDGTSWDIINPTAAIGIAIPSGATLWKSIGLDVGPTTIALGGGRPIRITRIDANTWTMLGSQ